MSFKINSWMSAFLLSMEMYNEPCFHAVNGLRRQCQPNKGSLIPKISVDTSASDVSDVGRDAVGLSLVKLSPYMSCLLLNFPEICNLWASINVPNLVLLLW